MDISTILSVFLDYDRSTLYLAQNTRVLPINFEDLKMIFLSQAPFYMNRSLGRENKTFYVQVSRFHGYSVSVTFWRHAGETAY